MTKEKFLRIALPTPLRRLFDYLPPQAIDPNRLIPGVRVKVPFQSRTLIGVLVDVVSSSTIPYQKLKKTLAILDESPLLPADVYRLCEWAAAYYHHAFGEVLAAALPPLLRKGNAPIAHIKPRKKILLRQALALNSHQQQAVDAICAAKKIFKVFLLEGVTGSGKTEVYLRAMAETLNQQQQVLVLVPEISLTPQTIERFETRFAVPIVALHSNLTTKARLAGWEAARANMAKIIIGTRSAIFTPFADLGLIIVDEEHDGSFKQQDRFRYHARDLAVMRAHLNHIPIVLGSATPSLESLFNVKRARYTHLLLPERAGNAVLPQYQFIDLRQTTLQEGLSNTLLNAIKTHLAAEQQVMLFLNRRGFAPVLYCTSCQAIIECQRCDTRMVYHKKPPLLRCHHCAAEKKVPLRCGKCEEQSLQPIGLGTQRLEETLKLHFPDVPIIRFDRDNTRRKNALQDLLTQIHQEKKAILLGTQMLAKGHHFPNVTLVGVIDADNGLFSADFRAAEQMGQLLLQVAGRAGREDKRGTVFIQTYYPDHPLLQTLIYSGFSAFAETLLKEREQFTLPPFSYWAIIRAEAHKEQALLQFLNAVKSLPHAHPLSLQGPSDALLAKRRGLHCKHLIIKARERSAIQQFLQTIIGEIESLAKNYAVKWGIDVDPLQV